MRNIDREIDKLITKEIPKSGSVSLKQVEIKDDGAINFTPRNIAGILIVQLSTTQYALVSYNASPMPVCIKIVASALVDVSTSLLIGTSGTDGRITIAAFGGKLYIENRTGTILTGGYLAL